ncbi:MAG: hypothetical protein JXR46_08460 [Calditrichaceae bacterium]|nr:hypothetical protein [Calditrichaceae bacterium]MBN2709063.1 hypothetical protein [Calditrichaceae bacterium]RQV97021.1 MAG: hypothetical protein EH224_02685 [Calditrichota bacterium]
MKDRLSFTDWFFIFYIIFIVTTSGFLFLFFSIYIHVNDAYIIQKYYQGLLINTGICTLFLAPLIPAYEKIRKVTVLPVWMLFMRKIVYGLATGLVLLYLSYLLHRYGIEFRLFELIAAFIFIYLSYLFYDLTRGIEGPAWQHYSARIDYWLNWLLAGSAIALVTLELGFFFHFICVLLVLGLLNLIFRIHIFNTVSSESRGIIRRLLIQYKTLFALRIIIGTFIPLVLCFQFYFLNGSHSVFMAVCVLTGIILDLFLLIRSSEINSNY